MEPIAPETSMICSTRGCIFDVDGLLINSEDIYTDAMNIVLRAHGVQRDLPWHIKARQQSRGRKGIANVLRWADLEMPIEDFQREVNAQQHLFYASKLLPGVQELLEALSSSTNVGLAIASSSGRALFHVKTDHIPVIDQCIPRDCRIFGTDPEMAGRLPKPSPDIFLLALDRLNQNLPPQEPPIEPSQCLVFEDSTAGVEAGLRAGMRVVWVPHRGLREVYKGREDFVLRGRSDCLEDDVNQANDSVVRTNDHSGPENGEYHGRAEMVQSLEHFHLQKFGIAPVIDTAKNDPSVLHIS